MNREDAPRVTPNSGSQRQVEVPTGTIRHAQELRKTLGRIDGRGYKAYKDIEGVYDYPEGFTLFVDHVQGDPFASPSRLRVRVTAGQAGFPGRR